MPTFVNHPVINLYAKPNRDSEVASQALYGWEVLPISHKGNFRRVQTADGYQGWVEAHCLIEKAIPPSRNKAKIIHNAAHIYCEKDTTTRRPLMTLPFEVELEVISEPKEEQSRWIQIQLLDDTCGWIQRGDVVINPRKIDLKDILPLSQQFIGLPYTWGGVSSFGFDCSGYIQMLFRQMGVSLPRDAKDQICCSHTKTIPLANAQAGDLIFFGPSEAKITHVAFCLDSQRIIHASVKPKPILQTTPLNDPGLKERFAYFVAKRINL